MLGELPDMRLGGDITSAYLPLRESEEEPEPNPLPIPPLTG